LRERARGDALRGARKRRRVEWARERGRIEGAREGTR
jgi:hypothetical protein